MDSEKANEDVVLDKIELKEKERGKKRWDENGFEEQGGYMAAKKAKLEHQFTESATSNTGLGIFNGISIHINGYVDPPEPKLRELFILHGGTYHPYRTANTTFVIASSLSRSSKNLYGPKAVKADWITESISTGQMLDHRKYLLYDYNKEQNQYTLSQVVNKAHSLTNDKDMNGHSPITNGSNNDYMDDSANGIDSVDHDKGKMPTENNNKEKVIDANITVQAQKVNVVNPEVVSKLNSSGINGTLGVSTNGEAGTSGEIKNLNTEVNPGESNDRIHSIQKMKFITDDGYIEDFFGNSRLHLLSRHKKTMQILVSGLRKKCSTHNYPNLEIFKREKRVSSQQAPLDVNHSKVLLMHIDLDCFFVSVGLLSRSHLINKPLIVSHSKGTTNNSKSDVACASYEARKFGVRNGMWVSQAKQLCPTLEIIPYDFDEYKRVSTLFFETVATVTLNIEPGSIDEMVVDVTSILQQVPDSTPEELAAFFRKIIFDATKCPASVGIGVNKLHAKLAVTRAKPDGVYFLKHPEVLEFIASLPIREIPGIGHSHNATLNDNFSAKTCKEVLNIPIEELKSKFGERFAEKIRCLCLGIYSSELSYDAVRPKHVSVDINYGVRFTHDKDLFDFIVPLSKEMSRRLEEYQATALNLQLKLLVRRKGAGEPLKYGGHGLVDTLTRSGSCMQSTRNWSEIYRLLSNLLRRASVPATDLRGIGIICSNLLFDFDKKGPKTKQMTLAAMSYGKEMIQKSQLKALKGNQHSVSTSTVDSSVNADVTAIPSSSAVVDDKNKSGKDEVQNNINSTRNNEDLPSSSNGISETCYIQTDQASQYSLLDSQVPSNSVIQSKPQSSPPKAIAAPPPSNEWLSPHDSGTVDINVLKELPKYLALEVAREYGIHLDESQLDADSDVVNGIPPQEDEEQVDYTRIEDPDTDANIDNQGNNFYPQINAEMNPYQNIESLDPSFLSALPANVRNEVVIQFQQAKGLKGQYPSHNSIDDPQPCSSRQAIERDMQLRNGNMGPLGVCESVYNVPTLAETSSSSSSMMTSSKTMKPHSNMIRRVLEEEKALAVNETRMPSPTKSRSSVTVSATPIDWPSFWNCTYPCKPLCQATAVSLPEICEETEVEEVRKKIREGLQEIEPTEKDVENLTLYFDALLNRGYVSQAQVLIRMIHRELESAVRQKWDNVLRDLILHVQRVCKKKYGGYLRYE